MPELRPSLPIAIILALLAGAIAATGFEPWGLWPLTLVGVAVLAGLVDTAPTRGRAALLGWLFGTAHFTASLGWIATAFTFQSKMPAALGWLTVVLLSMFLALY
ncbi:MAG: apolipoprotein N-acyltransferase, partial [Polymorphobacter sp.]